MKPWSLAPLTALRQVRGVFTDIDDTLTTDGAITPDALAALHALKAAGLSVIAITGRPVGWSLPFVVGDTGLGIEPWPVDAIVAENGAVALMDASKSAKKVLNMPFVQHPRHNLLSKSYQTDEATRAANFAHLQVVMHQIEAEVPGARRATDSGGRETDIAIDHSEFAHLSESAIAQVTAIMRAAGLTATVSSIHVNGWLGEHNKLQGAHWIVRELFGRDLSLEMADWLFVGDSTNDQSMFEAFGLSVGVANVARFAGQLTHLPKFVTPQERGAGFAQVVSSLLSAQAVDRG